MSFTDDQVRALSAKLDSKFVKAVERDGKFLSYIEGWHAIAEANRVFGYDAWDRQTVSSRCVWEGVEHHRYSCSYTARVRIRVRAGDIVVCREGSGFGHSIALTPGEAHENAIKEAETDAMKRTLVTFGNPFGLALYDREQEGVRRPRRKSKKALIWSVHNEKGKIAGRHENPVEFCIALKSIVTDAKSAAHLMDIWRWNQDTVAHLRQNVPELKTDRDRHYSELLSGLYTQRLTEFAAQAKPPSERQDVEAASKSSGSSSDGETDVGDNLLGQKQNSEIVAKAAELKSSRIRDPDHLKTVAKLACLVCGREPSHAHHIKYAEPRALGRKVGDQWVVPLCATHHRQLHEFGNEETWWQNNRIDPLSEAARIWNGNVATTNQETGIEV